ncbi:MAG: hypothetical protein HKN89_03990 [Eudoraea sp.]|nr:hypothetical protein [Eudoraea sp.]
MKAIITFILILFFGAAAIAQSNDTTDVKVETIEMGIVLDLGSDVSIDFETVETEEENQVARVYRNKNSRVKKAISFTTKNDRPKLA